MTQSAFYLLVSDSNERGDLLTRVARDLCHALGFNPLRTNVNRTGREVDIIGEHRLEKGRFICVECKSSATPIGGADINKFVGVLDAERRRCCSVSGEQATTAGYFVSLEGFTDSALEQEVDRGDRRLAGC